jgi:hypothetical protein
MGKTKVNRVKWLHLRISQREYDVLQDLFKQSICRKLSVLVRDLLFRRPIGVFYRNKSADDFLSVAIKLKNELNGIGNNLNQAVKGLHSFQTDRELSAHLFSLEADRRMILNKASEIQQKLQAIYDLLNEDPRTLKLDVIAPILSDNMHAAAADQQENKSERQ